MKKAIEFLKLVESSSRILITSHISPDPDAVCSTLLLGTTLETNYQKKEVRMVLEEEPESDLSFLDAYKKITFGSLLEAADGFQPDLFVIVDAMNFDRICRSDSAKLMHAVKSNPETKLAIVDHHTDLGLDQSDLYINDQQASTTLQLHGLLFGKLNLLKPSGYAQTTLLGIIGDTNRFLHENPHHKETFAIVSQLLDEGASIEKLENRLNRYSHNEMQVLANLFLNTVDSKKGYSYSFVDDKISALLLDSDNPSLKRACGHFVNGYIRNLDSNQWGFIVYPEKSGGKITYSVSLRSETGVTNVSEIAAKMKGGGHEGAAGAKGILASDVNSAIKFVESVIADTKRP